MSEQKDILLRVTQMNALHLDKEMHNSLYQIFVESTKNLPPGLLALFEPEIQLGLRLLVLKNSILSNGSTFGQQLLSIKYEDISTPKKVLYTLGCCLDYVRSKSEIWNPSHEISNIISKFFNIIKLLEFINTSLFLRGGVKPQLVDRILGLNQVNAAENTPKQFESKYLARELLWNGFIEIMVYVLPLINYHKIKRIVKSWKPAKVQTFIDATSSITSKISETLFAKCAYCGENPILPHHMGCSHIFCYICLKGNQRADSGFECPVCNYKNSNVLCERVIAE